MSVPLPQRFRFSWVLLTTPKLYCEPYTNTINRMSPINFVVLYYNVRSSAFLGLLGFLIRQLKI